MDCSRGDDITFQVSLTEETVVGTRLYICDLAHVQYENSHILFSVNVDEFEACRMLERIAVSLLEQRTSCYSNSQT